MDLCFRDVVVIRCLHDRKRDLPCNFVRNSDNLPLALYHSTYAVFNETRRQVFSASNDDILITTEYEDVALIVHHSLIPGRYPMALLIIVKTFVVTKKIAADNQISAVVQLARFASM
ncbi:MAG: hypothetical protein LQ339_002010 [Xanthoria mediterranea]|nr:MAG: hypothetical protein LQ339_002010 [Xanthoria mediterranea]